jgi:hypothetical protein
MCRAFVSKISSDCILVVSGDIYHARVSASGKLAEDG